MVIFINFYLFFLSPVDNFKHGKGNTGCFAFTLFVCHILLLLILKNCSRQNQVLFCSLFFNKSPNTFSKKFYKVILKEKL